MKSLLWCLIVLGAACAFSAAGAGAQEGCTNFLGRAKERMCQTQGGYDACLVALRQGSVDVCLREGDANSVVRRATPLEAEADLKKRGCVERPGRVFQCPQQAASYCKGYENYFKLSPVAANVSIRGCAQGEDGNIYLYAAKDGAVWLNKRTKGGWGGWQSLGGQGVAGLDACSPNPGKMLVMLRGVPNNIGALVMDHSRPGAPHAWLNYHSLVGSDPSVACQAGDKVQMYVRAHNSGQLYTTHAEGGTWARLYKLDTKYLGLAIEDVAAKATTPEKKSFSIWDYLPGGPGEPFTSSTSMLGVAGLGGNIKGSPEAVAFGGGNQAVFVRGANDNIWWRRWDGSNWSEWADLGGQPMTSDPTAVSRRAGEILLFARGQDNKLYVRQFANGEWKGLWFPWGGTVAGNPDAASWGGDRVDVFYRGPDGSIYHAWLDNAAYGQEPRIEKVPGITINGDPTAVAAKW